MNHNFLLLVVSRHKSRVNAREARQSVCPRFISVVCGLSDSYLCETGQVEYSKICNDILIVGS